MAERLKWYSFYPADWRNDPVMTCSLAARGLWIELLNLMHLSTDRYGYISQNGKPMSDDAIARYVGCSVEEYRLFLSELITAGVPRVTSNGIIFSKRMVEDEAARCRKRNGKATETAQESITNESPPSIYSCSFFSVSKKEDSLLGEAYPWIERLQEYKKAHAWLAANSSRLPKNTFRFLQNWFNRMKEPAVARSVEPTSGPQILDNPVCLQCGHTRVWHGRTLDKKLRDEAGYKEHEFVAEIVGVA